MCHTAGLKTGTFSYYRKTIARWVGQHKALLGVLIVLCLLVAAGVYVYGNYRKITVRSAVDSPSPSPSPIDTRYANVFNQGNPYAILLMGYGGGTHEGGKLTDSMILTYIEPKLQRVTLISVPRDLWVSLPINEGQPETSWKINAAYAIGADDRGYPHKPLQFTGDAGGGELAKYAINKVTGLHVDKFVALDFYGFTKTIDTLGGVTVKVEKTFDDYQYPIEGEEKNSCGRSDDEIKALAATMSAGLLEQSFTCRYEHLHFDAGKQQMDGTTALKYVRSRHSAQDGNDFGRAARQRNLILAVRDKVFTLNFLPKAIPFVNTLAGSLTTDIDINDMQTFLKFSDELKGYSILTVALTDQNVLVQARSQDGQFTLQPKAGDGQWSSIQDYIKEQMATTSAEVVPSASP